MHLKMEYFETNIAKFPLPWFNEYRELAYRNYLCIIQYLHSDTV